MPFRLFLAYDERARAQKIHARNARARIDWEQAIAREKQKGN